MIMLYLEIERLGILGVFLFWKVFSFRCNEMKREFKYFVVFKISFILFRLMFEIVNFFLLVVFVIILFLCY